MHSLSVQYSRKNGPSLAVPCARKRTLQLKEEVMAKFSSWKIPFASIPFKSHEIELCTCWRDSARKNILTSSLSNSRIDILTKAYSKANIHKQFVSTNAFIRDLVSAAQNRYPIPCLQ